MIGMCGNVVRRGFQRQCARVRECSGQKGRPAMITVALRSESHRILVRQTVLPSQKNSRNGRNIKVVQAQAVEKPVAASEKHGSHQGISGKRFAPWPAAVTLGSGGTSPAMNSRLSGHARRGRSATMSEPSLAPKYQF
jgi:hypothetical protein